MLLTCIECENSVSEYATACPHCGCPITVIRNTQSNNTQCQEEQLRKYGFIVDCIDDYRNTDSAVKETKAALENAISHIKSIARNPNSLQINNVKYCLVDNTFMLENGHAYLEIDCSAQNGWGGWRREIFYYHNQCITMEDDDRKYSAIFNLNWKKILETEM